MGGNLNHLFSKIVGAIPAFDGGRVPALNFEDDVVLVSDAAEDSRRLNLLLSHELA